MNKRIVYQSESGDTHILIPVLESGLTIEEIAAKDVPEGRAFRIVPVEEIPTGRLFRNAWKPDLSVDVPKAKKISHEIRRKLRAEEMAPLDAVVALRIPGKTAADAEAGRAVLRGKYAEVQTEIDAASTPEELKAILEAVKA